MSSVVLQSKRGKPPQEWPLLHLTLETEKITKKLSSKRKQNYFTTSINKTVISPSYMTN